jgi:CYTH domain-containing protein
MDKTNRTEMHRSFLIDGLPEPLTRASAHLQIFDNYIEGTRLRLRSVRDPDNGSWTRILQQRFPAAEDNLAVLKVTEIYLIDAEYAHFQIFEGSEIRKNRYFHEFDGRVFAFDVFLGALWGLNIARVELGSAEELDRFQPPPFAVLEVTSEPFFDGGVLVTKSFEDVRAELAKFSETIAESNLADD